MKSCQGDEIVYNEAAIASALLSYQPQSYQVKRIKHIMVDNHLPSELVNALAQGSCVVVLGSNHDGCLETLARDMARECEYPQFRKTHPVACLK